MRKLLLLSVLLAAFATSAHASKIVGNGLIKTEKGCTAAGGKWEKDTKDCVEK